MRNTRSGVVDRWAGHVDRNHWSRCRNPPVTIAVMTGHFPGISGHVGPEYALRQTQSAPLLQEFKAWLVNQRLRLMKADVTAKAMDYALKRWAALTIHLTDARIPIDNNAVENAIRPLALGRKNWLFVGSQQAGERAAVLMTLIESAKLNGHDAWAYLKDILTRLPTWPNSPMQELLPHNWSPPETTAAPACAPSTPER